MKIKHFLRGLGTGIIFSVIVMLVAYMTSGIYKLSDEEIVERAKALGMVMAEENVPDGSEEGDTSIAINTTEGQNNGTIEEVKGEDGSTEANISTEKSTEDDTEVSITEATTESNTTEERPPVNTDFTKATITVSAGMTSTQVAQLLQDAGIIVDYLDFDNYLNRNGYSTQIRVNTYDFDSNMTYEEIAQELIKEE